MDECLTLEDVLTQQKKEKKELLAKTQKLKHGIPKGDKKKKKEVTAEIAQMIADLDIRHDEELKEFQRPGEWLTNYFSVICPQAGQIAQPQSYAFLHGVDSMRSTLDWRSLSAALGWSVKCYCSPWTPLGLFKAGQFYCPLALLLRCSGDLAEWSSLSRERS
ncbi:hypothetical protein AVEN_192110-1 [Araneus ventricosus]|uniref:Uncharacterized protein n=1 Tax=Araneus ventricosus TaxID=182803 RepID=A0A4Y2B9E8_ARAVE|nr:hypothetical protein AVEN_192110-1 [Araneus ventricosus]